MQNNLVDFLYSYFNCTEIPIYLLSLICKLKIRVKDLHQQKYCSYILNITHPFSHTLVNLHNYLNYLNLGTSLFCFYFYPLCHAVVPLKFIYYVQEQELLSDYYTIYVQVCMNCSLHLADNFKETILLECIKEWHQSRLLCFIIRWLFY